MDKLQRGSVEKNGTRLLDSRKAILREIFDAGLGAVDPEHAVHGYVQRTGNRLRVGDRHYELDNYRKVVIAGAGKGAAPMAKALEDILAERLSEGCVVVKYGHGLPLRKTRIFEAAHPIPDNAGLNASRYLIDHLQELTVEDLVLFVFSGGSSALLPAPRGPIELAWKQEITRLLLECGAGVDEINTIRKHLSLTKGGALARIAYPSTVISLYLSDVIGDRIDVIASGPTAPDSSTYADCLKIIERYGLGTKIPKSIMDYLERGANGLEQETPKADDPVFEHVQNLVVGSNRQALLAAAEKASDLGYKALVLSSLMSGEARDVARVFSAIAKEICISGHPVPAPACILAGGETTVTIRGPGKGGRNQELALAAAIAIDGWERISLLSAGTDGTDGPTEAAGAFADGETCALAREMDLDPMDYLSENNSYAFFRRMDDLLITGPTRTNVMDLICMLIE